MTSGKNSMPSIAVIRGGTAHHGTSLEEGVIFLKSLTSLGYEPIDVVIDKSGTWNHKGMPTDAHAIFTKAEGYIDTTRMHDAPHHILAKKMGIKNLFPHHKSIDEGDRETMYRVLRQRGLIVPDTFTVRASQPIDVANLREVWVKFHTPLMVRPLMRKEGIRGKLVRSFKDLLEAIEYHHNQGIDMHVLTYTNAPVYSIAVLPNYRNESWYMPLPVKVFPEKDEIPHELLTVYHYTKGDIEEKTALRAIAVEVVQALDIKSPVCVDIIRTKRGFVIVNVETNPSLREDGRFMQSLSTTGVDVGHYAQSRLFL